ncbi:MAG: cell division protein SepF [Clostridioides sp.]|jgi:cell division inhibitor SepF|nr:cell division protein SepF [Clostridioides sp.]
MADGIINKFKNWIVDEDEYIEDEELDELEDGVYEDDGFGSNFSAPKSNKIVNIHTANQMKVAIVEPKEYDDVVLVADNLKQRKAVVVNLESLADIKDRKPLLCFMHGIVYVLEGSMQRVSKSIYILTPNNVEIDANMKRELEDSKALFPWQNK